jgi:cation/acetate symporter
MATTHRTRLINPRLGAYFSIFASTFIALFLVLMILQQLGTSDGLVRAAVLFAPLVLFSAIGIGSFTRHPPEFFAAGRRVPAFYNGIVLAMTVTGGTGLVVATGLLFINGFDAWCLIIGLTAGCVVMGTMIAPYLRKYGGYTVPSYLGRRFDSRAVRIASAAVFIVPMLLLLMAEIHLARSAAVLLTGFGDAQIMMVLALTLLVTVAFGGIRGLGWVGAAQAIGAIIAIVVPAAMLGVIETNLPLAQLSYGPVLRSVGRMEVAQQIAIPQMPLLGFDLAGQGLTSLQQRVASPYTSMGPLSFALTTLTAMLGIACAPWLLPRTGTTVGVYEARKSLSWAVFFLGIIMLTLSALAVFLRNYVMLDLVGRSPADLPDWFTALASLGQATAASTGSVVSLANISFDRDSVLYAVAIAAGFPPIVLYLLLAGTICAALAAAAATLYCLATIIAEDIILGLDWRPIDAGTRLTTSRLAILVMTVIGIAFAWTVQTDPLQLLLWALSLSAATAFPIVVMSIWWKRMSPMSAFAGLLAGFVGAVFGILNGDSFLIPLPAQISGLLGIVPAIGVATCITLFGPPANRQIQDAVRDIRIPGGETIYDREQRLLRLKQQRRN